jgi:uncharacterized repeat protein (TIGR03803 family)
MGRMAKGSKSPFGPVAPVADRKEEAMKTSTTGLRLAEVRAFRRELLIAVLVGSMSAVAGTAQTYEIVHAFRNSGQPARLVDARELLYGATQSALTQAADGYLYGTSYWGGTNGVGTIFKIDSPGNVATVHSFAYADGANPAASLIQATDGYLYGTATRGGANNLGTVFRMDSSGKVTDSKASTAATGRIRERLHPGHRRHLRDRVLRGDNGRGTTCKWTSQRR